MRVAGALQRRGFSSDSYAGDARAGVSARIDLTVRLLSHGIHAPRSLRAVRQPPLPRHHELRSGDRRAHVARRSWTRRSMPASTSSTPPTSTAGRRARASPSRSSADGSRRVAAGARRSCIATKLYGSMSDWPNDTFLSARNIRNACEGSLRRLQTDHIDLYQMHHVDRSTPFDEIWEAMEVLVQQGKVLYVGSSNFAGWTIAQAQETGARPALPRPGQRAVPVQPRRASRRGGGRSRRRCTTASGSSPGARSSAACSAASSPSRPPADARRRSRRRSLLDAPLDRSSAYEALCAKLGEHPSAVGLAWLLQQPGRHRADRRTADARAVPEQPPCAGRAPRRPSARGARRDLPGTGHRTRGLGLVASAVRRRRRRPLRVALVAHHRRQG